MAFITVKKVNARINNNIVLDDVSFTVKKGEILCIIGPNGSGKTTLIRTMLGLIPFRGSILWDHSPIKNHLDEIGYVPQRFDFDRTFPITVREFLNLSARALEKPSAREICRELHIDTIVDKKLGDLSGGQLQRVLIAQSTIKEPQLLILDEPTSSIDVEGIKDFYGIIRHINEHHQATIILVLHEISTVHKLADTVVCLNKKVMCSGDPKQVMNEEMLEKLFRNPFELRP